MLLTALKELSELIFPPYCAGCGRLGTFLCPICYEQVYFFTLPVTLKLELCYLDRVIAVGNYQEPLRSLIHLCKYKHVKDVGKILARLTYHTTALPSVDCLTYVPLHPRRLEERGFNQAAEIAKELAVVMKVPVVNILERTRYTTTQASITDRQERLAHLQNCFSLKENNAPLPSSILLVDDVTTTGTTLNECAKVLKEAGAKSIVGLTIAHGS